MSTKRDLEDWVHGALRALGGSATLVDIAKNVWDHHQDDLRSSGDLFYTWQYDMRWAANRLRNGGTMKPVGESPAGIWELVQVSAPETVSARPS